MRTRLAASKPIFVYRRSAKPQIDLDDPDVESKRGQYEAVKRFFSGFTNADGSLLAGFTSYADPGQFSALLRQHLEAFVNERLGGRAVVTLPAVAPDDPMVVQILTLVDELGRKNRQLDERNAEIDRLIRENTDLRRAAIARTLTAAAQPGAADAATAAADALRAGDTQLAEHLLREQERADAAHLGRGDADDAAVRRQAAARAREQGALAMGHNVRAALAAYQRAADYEPDDTWTHFLLGDLHARVGTLDAAMRSYRRGAGTADARLRLIADDVDAQRDLSVSHERIGNVLVAQGDGPGALAAYRTGLAIGEALAARDPANTEWQRDLSVSHERIGDVLVAQGDGPGALAAYRTGLAIREALAARDPANTEWQRDLSVSHERIGNVLVAQGDGPGALAAYRTGLAIREALAARDPANTEWQRDLSVSQSKIGDVLVAQGDGPGALAAYRTGLAIGEALAARDPTNSQWVVDVAVSCARLGSLTREHTTGTRRAHFMRGREILVRLKTEGRLLPHHDWITWFDRQMVQLTEEDGQPTTGPGV